MRMLLVLEEVKCGGAEMSFFALCRALSLRCEVHLAVSQSSLTHPTMQRLCDALIDTSVRVHRCHTALNPGTHSTLHRVLRRAPARELASLIREIRPAVVLVNLPTVERGQTVVDAAELCSPRPPVWGFLHLSQRPSTIGAKLGWVRDLLVPRLIRRFDRLFTVSEAGAREVRQRYGLPAPVVIQPPTEIFAPSPVAADRSALRRARGLPDIFLLGMVGRIDVHHKGQDVALRVTQRLIRQGHALQLVIVGDGPDRPSLQHLAERLGIASAVRFLGWRDDVAELIPLLDAVLMPSRYEGLPQVAIQAVTAYVPVVGYAVDGLAELLPQGYAVPPGDEAGLVGAVVSVLRDPHRWPAREVALKAAAWCAPGNAADKLAALLVQAEGRPAVGGSLAASP